MSETENMKRIEAIIQPSRVASVRDALGEIGQEGLTFVDVRGFGRQKGHKEHYRGTEYNVNALPKVLVIAFMMEDRVKKAVEVIIKASCTDTIGDGKIIISSVDEVIRVRTGEKGQKAL